MMEFLDRRKNLLYLYLLNIIEVLPSTSWLLHPTPSVDGLFSVSGLVCCFVIFELNVILTGVGSVVGAGCIVMDIAFVRLALLILNNIFIAIFLWNILNVKAGNASASK